ncbi:transmembrane protein 186 [Cricetulus griseus]|uniref:Transmembrane protein 186 n=1 Tax=Cricetulus griseus TaxID=10029 RepID=G3GVN1_CRIGR|nr:transmembrane protein 186 [Cricetulus griseus]EGV96899.1 Transmembrane protein 186 [Cricetulus griseus]
MRSSSFRGQVGLLFTAGDRIMSVFLRAVPRFQGPATWGRPLHRLWCCTGQGDSNRWVTSKAPTLQEKPPGTETEKFHTIYRFRAIKRFGFLSRLKLAQTFLTVTALPPGLYWYSQGLLSVKSLYLMSGVSCFTLAMLCWMSYFFQRLVGFMYVNESGTVLRVAHLSFFGWRQDTYCAVSDIIPLSESKEHAQDLLVRIQQYGGKKTFYVTLRYGRILDRERFSQVFGNPTTLKKNN